MNLVERDHSRQPTIHRISVYLVVGGCIVKGEEGVWLLLLFSNFKDLFFYLMYLGICLCVCMPVHHVYALPLKARIALYIPLELVVGCLAGAGN